MQRRFIFAISIIILLYLYKNNCKKKDQQINKKKTNFIEKIDKNNYIIMSLSFSLKLNTLTFHHFVIKIKIINNNRFLFIAAIYDGRIFQWIEFRFIKYFNEKSTQGFFRFLSISLYCLSLFPAKGERIYEQQKNKWWIANFLFHLPQQQFFILLHSGILKINFMFYYPSSLFILSLIILCQSSFSPAKAVKIMWGNISSQCSFFFLFAFKITNSLFLLPYKNRSFFLLIFLSHSIAVIL